jgi:hypothetical protein
VRSRAALALFSCGVALTLTAPRTVGADEDRNGPACAADFESGQRLRREGALREARTRLARCSQVACREAFQSECARWVAEIGHVMPSLVVVVREADGRDARDARVTIDGEAVVLDGHAVEVDPGPHRVHVDVEGRVFDQEVTAALGEQARTITIKLPAAEPATASPAPEETGRRIPLASWILGGIGIAGLGTFAVLGLVGNGKYSDLEACRSRGCSHDDVVSTKSVYLAGDIALGVGILALAGGIAVYFLQPSGSRTRGPKAAR